MTTKKCGKCGEIKASEEFYIERRRKDGLMWHCKACQREYNRHYRRVNPDYDFYYYQANREKRIKYQKRYAADKKRQAEKEIL